MRTDIARIAWLSPFPPQRSGIANYSYWLVQALQRSFSIDLYCDYDRSSAAPVRTGLQVYSLTRFAEHYQDYDQVLYHLGNHRDFHEEIYKLAWHFPGIIVLHDYNLSAFMHDAFYGKNNEGLYERALLEGYGEEGRQQLQAVRQGCLPDGAEFPMSHALVNRSKRVIVHHRWIKNQFENNGKFVVIPHFAKLNRQPTPQEVQIFKDRLKINGKHFIVSCLGFINSNKLPMLQVEVVKRLINEGYPIKLIFAGQPAPDVERLVHEVRVSDHRSDIIFTGYLNDTDYCSAIVASDLIINLRNPSMGEASGSLMQALAARKPTIVSNINQYREFPDTVCWKLTHDENQAALLYSYISVLLSNRRLRATIANNVDRYVGTVLAWDNIIERWLETLASC